MTDEHFTEVELRFLRHARFGELPARVRPEDLVPLQETDAKRDLPDNLPDTRNGAISPLGA